MGPGSKKGPTKATAKMPRSIGNASPLGRAVPRTALKDESSSLRMSGPNVVDRAASSKRVVVSPTTGTSRQAKIDATADRMEAAGRQRRSDARANRVDGASGRMAERRTVATKAPVTTPKAATPAKHTPTVASTTPSRKSSGYSAEMKAWAAKEQEALRASGKPAAASVSKAKAKSKVNRGKSSYDKLMDF